ncbi:MAG: class I SAM-dependent methyltransferase [Verrucomicrobiota bacterium]
MQPKWDERYSEDEFAFGTEPNTFLVQQASLLSGPVLALAEGEGRNAVYMATIGLEVYGVDASSVGLAKAHRLADSRGVSIQTDVVDLAEFNPRENHYGTVVSIFAHLPSAIRQRLYPLVERCLVPGGLILCEAYSKEQIHRDTGGPKDLDLLMSRKDFESAFPNCDIVLSQEIDREVLEGCYHTGLASVVQFVARKRKLG